MKKFALGCGGVVGVLVFDGRWGEEYGGVVFADEGGEGEGVVGAGF